MKVQLGFAFFLTVFVLVSCSRKEESKEEQIRTDIEKAISVNDTSNSINGDLIFDQLTTNPKSVVITGLAEHRLITIYRVQKETEKTVIDRFRYSSGSENEGREEVYYDRFMPGIDILYGYRLFNIGHYNLATEKLDFLFKRPAMIKTVYYPSVEQDSVNKIPLIRNYVLISAYDEDTNQDTLINEKDLRHFYHIDLTTNEKTSLIPRDYSVKRSQYDSKNDIMYIFASHDSNKNGVSDHSDSRHIFWIRLKEPKPAKKLY